MHLKCPECRQQLRVADDLADRVIRCPTCGALFRTNAANGGHPRSSESRQRDHHSSLDCKSAYANSSHDLKLDAVQSSGITRQVKQQPFMRSGDSRQEQRPVEEPASERASERASEPGKQLFLAVDVSTSVRKHLEIMHWHLTQSLRQIRDSGPFEIAVYMFHRHVMPFPSAQLCFPRPYEQAHIPSLEELQQRVGGGTAILDTLDRLLTDAQQSVRADRRVILLTDGWERSSKRTNESQLRAKIQALASQIDISLTGFVDSRSHDCLVDLAQRLRLPPGSWAFAQHWGTEESISDSIQDMSLELVKFAVLGQQSPSSKSPSSKLPVHGRSSSAHPSRNLPERSAHPPTDWPSEGSITGSGYHGAST